RIGTQAEPLADIAGEAGTEIAGAGADEERIDLADRGARAPERPAPRPLGEGRRMLAGAAMKHVRIALARLGEPIEREVARADAVLAEEHALEKRARSRRKAREARRGAHRVPALFLAVARGGNRRPEADQVHDSIRLRELRKRSTASRP